MRRLILFFMLALLLTGCGPRVGGKPRVLLIGLDGVSWDLLNVMIKAGELPNFARLQENGAWGVLESEAPVPPMSIWATIATGRTAADHHVIGPIVYDAVNKVLLEPERESSAIWEIAAAEGIPAGVIGWPGSAPVPEPVRVAVDDLAYYRGLGLPVRQEGEVLTLPTGETPPSPFAKEAPVGAALNVRLAAAALEQTPVLAKKYWPRVRVLAVFLDGANSARHYAGATAALSGAPAEPEFGVLSRQHLRRLDAAVGQLLDLADAHTLIMVASDDASYAPTRSPDTGFAHPIHGLAAVAGPGIAAGVRMENPTVLDFVPMALVYLGLPLAEQMAGRPFPEAWEDEPPDTGWTASHDTYFRRNYPEEGPLRDKLVAARLARLAAEASPDRPPFTARNVYALELLQEGKVLAALGEAQRDDQRNPVSQYLIGEIRLLQSNLSVALQNFQQAVESLGSDPPPDQRVLAVLASEAAARAYLESSEPEAAEAALQIARRLEADNPIVSELLVTIRTAQGRTAEAEQTALEALAKEPQDAALWLALGEIRQRAGNSEGAAEAFEKAISSAKEPLPAAHRALGLSAVAREDWPTAIRHLSEATRREPADSYAWFQLAQAYGRTGENDEQQAALLACLRADAETTEAWAAWRLLAEADGETREASRLLAAARESIAQRLLDFE